MCYVCFSAARAASRLSALEVETRLNEPWESEYERNGFTAQPPDWMLWGVGRGNRVDNKQQSNKRSYFHTGFN